jgi:hypothetical protein
MPMILPPHAFEVPAIIRVAAHGQTHPAAPRPATPPARGNTQPSPGPQPLGSGQGPEIVTPPARGHTQPSPNPQPLGTGEGPEIVTPPGRGNTQPSRGPQPLGGGEDPQIVTPPAAQVPPATTTTSGDSAGKAKSTRSGD